MTALLLLAMAENSHSADSTCALSIRLIDSSTGRDLPGLICVRDERGAAVKLEGLLDRGMGTANRRKTDRKIHDWYVAPKKAVVRVPAAKLTVRAFRGLETEMAETCVDLTGRRWASVTLKLNRFHEMRSAGYISGNTHLHFKDATRADSDRYLREVPIADDLNAVFVSYLERPEADKGYVTNEYTDAEWAALSRETGVLFANGEEHRHNFGEFDEGYGHVMFLNMPGLVRPVSLGPGITGTGDDGVPIRQGIDDAAKSAIDAIWCHNSWGFEDAPNILTRRVRAAHVFDGGSRGSYETGFYRYLNLGISLAFTSGTDWFIRDFARVYVSGAGQTAGSWLKALLLGKSFITNGPLLDLRIDGKGPGEVIDLPSKREISVTARAVGRVDFGLIELVRNGVVISTSPTRGQGGHFTADMRVEVDIDEPCWLALRIPPVSSEEYCDGEAALPMSEFGWPLFAHTSAVFVDIDGRRVHDEASVRGLIEDIAGAKKIILEKAVFASDADRARVTGVYDEALSLLGAPMR